MLSVVAHGSIEAYSGSWVLRLSKFKVLSRFVKVIEARYTSSLLARGDINDDITVLPHNT